ncbi:MAG: hypothetical protein IT202_01915 [Fimbriimonadaceae bacterium]|nr:hypothetical protein [Fimbriimonadaceae bacterium]
MVYVDPENDLVVVARWIAGNAEDDFIAMVLASIRDRQDRSPKENLYVFVSTVGF